MRLLRLALLLALISAAPAAAQEPSLPPDAVARVGDQVVLRSEFDEWFRAAARAESVDPPSFEHCVATLRKRTAERRSPPSRRELRQRCERRARAVRREVVRFLLQGVWVRQEAETRGIVVTLPQVAREFRRQKREAFESEREYRRHLRLSGFTEAQTLYRVAVSLLSERLSEQVADAAPPVTTDDVERYYASHRRAYRGIPRTKALRTIDRLLTARRQQRAIERFVKDFRARYRSTTVCAEAFAVPECGQRA